MDDTTCPESAPNAEQEDSMWGALKDSAEKVNGPKIIIVQQGVYNHDVYGPFGDLEIAKEAFLAFLETRESDKYGYGDADGYHDYVFYDHRLPFVPKELGRYRSSKHHKGTVSDYAWAGVAEEDVA